jgi:hypothetical protein
VAADGTASGDGMKSSHYGLAGEIANLQDVKLGQK